MEMTSKEDDNTNKPKTPMDAGKRYIRENQIIVSQPQQVTVVQSGGLFGSLVSSKRGRNRSIIIQVNIFCPKYIGRHIDSVVILCFVQLCNL